MIKKIYKFGGASVKDADAVRNLKNIVAQHKDEDIFLVVSAMGKTTNMLEKALQEIRAENGEPSTSYSSLSVLSEVMNYHEKIILDLFDQIQEHPVIVSVAALFSAWYRRSAFSRSLTDISVFSPP